MQKPVALTLFLSIQEASLPSVKENESKKVP
jgi:hypothetical protein